MEQPNSCPLVYDENSQDWMARCHECITWWNGTNTQRIQGFEKWQSHVRKMHEEKRSHKGNGTYRGPFAFTLTASDKDGYDEFDMIKAARRIMSQRSCPVFKYAWYLEYGKEGNRPHIHGMYETTDGGRIEAKHFKRAWPIWDEKTRLGAGFRGGYHRPVLSEEGYTDYIKKDKGKSESMNVPSDSLLS